ncbi:MAG: extracellular solute-binding protein [bacterium]|nr:extracellular solute-binding protein [bacterium]MCM1374978.1 extracellular solute-binding protein [Muribaculum sp.]
MKRGLWKKAIALSLAAMIGLGLAACNSGSNDNPGGNGGSGDGAAGGNVAGKENVYSYQELKLLKSNDNVCNMTCRDDKLYLLVYNWSGSGEESAAENTFGCYQAGVDGSASSFMELELPKKEESYSWINKTLITDSGYIYAEENSTYEDYSDPDNYIYEDRYYLNCWNPEGSLQWSKQLDRQAGAYCDYLFDGGDGRVLAIMSGDRNEAVLYSQQGEELSRRELSGEAFERCSSMYAIDANTLAVLFFNEEYTQRYLVNYDMETGTFGEQSELPFGDSYDVSWSSATELILSNSMGVYRWKKGDAAPEMLMNIVNSDLPADNMSYVRIVDDKHFVAMYNDIYDWNQKCAYFTYVDPKDIPDRESLILGGISIDSDVKARVIEFNKTSDQYRITLKDYRDYNVGEDQMAGSNRLSSDIISGQMPDIMMLDDIDSYNRYVDKGALADVSSLLAADPELSSQEYLQNVWDAYSVGGKLYAVVPNFHVRTMIAKKSLVGEPQSWTMADMDAVLAAMPQGAEAFGRLTQEGFLYQIMNFAARDFIDVETGKCDFQSQNFMEMLEYAKALPKEIEKDTGSEGDYEYSDESANQYRENRSLLYDLYIGNVRDCKYQIKGYMGEEVSFVGFPTESSKGSTLGTGSYIFVLSAKTKHMDGAWQFVRQFLTPEYQNSGDFYEMPVLKSAFLSRAQEATERPYWVNDRGEKEYYDDIWYINGEEVILEPFTQAEVDQICEFIYTVNRTSYYNEEIFNIIMEEAESFFSGQKTVQEVADIIQSRAQLYADENR